MRLRRFLIGVAVPALAGAQQPVRLAKPDATFPEPFTLIGSVRELRDGRVLVLDRRDRVVLLVDFRSEKAIPVGREGTGPGEYTQPGRLFSLPADTTAIYDGPARRFVIVHPDGSMGDAFRMDVATGAGRRHGGVPKGSDARGRVFTEGSAYVVGELRAADSTPIMRFARGSDTGDTVAYVHLDKATIMVRNEPGGGVSVSNGVRAFALRDDWVTLPDGGVAVIRVADYHIDWYSSSGVRTAGRPVVTPRIPVTDADKENAKAARLAAIRGSMSRSRPGGPGGGPPPNALPNLPELTFPAFKPPFEMGQTHARLNGEVWVLRSRAANDRVAAYDVFTRSGGLVSRVAFPRATQIVGFGNAMVYTVRIDDDELQYLERWKLNPIVP